MRNETLYRIRWIRRDFPEEGEMECGGLAPRVALSRLIGGIKNSGPITVLSVTPERR
jgi:hypothetical protein